MESNLLNANGMKLPTDADLQLMARNAISEYMDSIDPIVHMQALEKTLVDTKVMSQDDLLKSVMIIRKQLLLQFKENSNKVAKDMDSVISPYAQYEKKMRAYISQFIDEGIVALENTNKPKETQEGK